ncbi:MAG: fucose isomerase [Candidatus Hydrogenedentes bacterium]|nr:fucose isomerase [Candidatus Hydrogenedentota bacterium]
MAKRVPLMGFCPIGKFVFSNEDAVRYKGILQKKLTEWGYPYVDLEGVLPDGLIKDQGHVDAAVSHFRKAGVDCVFMPHCNFGTEGAVGSIARKLEAPVLLWGPRDESPLPDGRRLRDTLCGLFASSKVVYKQGVPFTYIENCRVDDPPLRRGVDTFLRAVNVADVFRKGVRIALVGDRIDFFWTTIINESELLQKFNIEVLPIDMVEFIRSAKNRAKKGRAGYEAKVKELRGKYPVEGLSGNDELINVLAVADELLTIGKDQDLAGFAFRGFMSIVDEMGSYCSHAESIVSEDFAFGYECDIHGAISDLILRRASFGAAPAYLAEFTVRHPTNDNAALLWHEGAPISMCHPEDTPKLGHHWILPSPLSGMNHFRLKDGALTVARFDGEFGEYKLAVGEGKTIEGPPTLNNYCWMEVNDWPRWERTLMEGPYIHHIAMAYGQYGDALQEACKYVPGLDPVRLGA